eukprot:529726-Amphidinium_carterae.1
MLHVGLASRGNPGCAMVAGRLRQGSHSVTKGLCLYYTYFDSLVSFCVAYCLQPHQDLAL